MDANDFVKHGESSSPSLCSIPLYLINGVATVWDAQTAATLHCKHNISGLRAGTLPGVSQQNGFLGLPITLMQEETAYLVRQGIAHLIPIAQPTLPSSSLVQSRTAQRLAWLATQSAKIQAEEEKREAERKKAFEKGGEAARLKREARAKAKLAKLAGGSEEGMNAVKGNETGFGLGGEEDVQNMEQNERTIVPKDIGTKSTTVESNPNPRLLDSSHSATTTFPSSLTSNIFHTVPSLPLHFFPLPTSPVHPTAITTIPHPLFPFPSTPRQLALLATFTALQQKGYRIGLGPRFGGEYLVYPGDYLRYHAHFTSQVLVRDEILRPAEIVAWGRLGTGTKKAGLICCWDDGVRDQGQGDGEEGEGLKKKQGHVEFYSLEWASFG